MKELMSLHYLVNCVAGFSFLSSAMFMALVHVPYAPMWSRLRKCKHYLSLVFLVVGLSCGKTIFLHLAPTPDIVVTSTLVSAGIQSLLFACTGITFVNPNWVNRGWICRNIALILTYSILLFMGLILWRPWFWISAIVACIIYFSLLISYQVAFFGQYNQCVRHTDTLTDEYSERRYAWIKHFFIAVSVLGVSAGIAPFLPTAYYDIWMLVAALFYVYVVLGFVNYLGNTAVLVNKVFNTDRRQEAHDESLLSKNSVPSMLGQQQPAEADSIDFSDLESALERWVAEHGFVKNDLVSEDFAHSLGVNLATLRAYFSQKYQMDFRQWRNKLRIEYACQILRENPDYSYDAIAEMVGICDRSNFMRIFKKMTGQTPREYSAQRQYSKDQPGSVGMS